MWAKWILNLLTAIWYPKYITVQLHQLKIKPILKFNNLQWELQGHPLLLNYCSSIMSRISLTLLTNHSDNINLHISQIWYLYSLINWNYLYFCDISAENSTIFVIFQKNYALLGWTDSLKADHYCYNQIVWLSNSALF